MNYEELAATAFRNAVHLERYRWVEGSTKNWWEVAIWALMKASKR